jgi:putative transposase
MSGSHEPLNANGVAVLPENQTYLPGIPAYVVLRSTGSDCFVTDEDFQFFVDVLGQACARYEVQLHAYCLLSHCANLLLTQEREQFGIGEALAYADGRYTMHLRQKGDRREALNGFHQVTMIDADHHLLNCYRQIELLPVREKLCNSPEWYAWSSYGYHALGKRNSRISDHYLYLALAADQASRCRRYRELFAGPIEESEIRQIRAALVFGEPLGDERFRTQIKKAQARRLASGFVPDPLRDRGDHRSLRH